MYATFKSNNKLGSGSSLSYLYAIINVHVFQLAHHFMPELELYLYGRFTCAIDVMRDKRSKMSDKRDGGEKDGVHYPRLSNIRLNRLLSQ